MIDRHTPFAHRLFEVGVADPVAALPSRRPQNHLTLKITPVKIRHHKFRKQMVPSTNQPEIFATEPARGLLRIKRSAKRQKGSAREKIQNEMIPSTGVPGVFGNLGSPVTRMRAVLQGN